MRAIGNQKGNVLVVGNSGVGKSTLINAVLGTEVAATGRGVSGTTKKITTYESPDIPFRLIDTAGFEPSFLNNLKVNRTIRKNMQDRAKKGEEDTNINAIWFCVDGNAAKLFSKTIQNFLKATEVWGSVPILVVITKSYSQVEREDNRKMVEEAFRTVRHNKRLPKNIIPVVAEPYYLNDTVFAPPSGMEELIEATNAVLPEGLQAAKQDVFSTLLNRKNVRAYGLIGAAAASAATVGAVPIPFADAAILIPLETGLIKGLASIYEIPKNDKTAQMANTLLELGTVGTLARGAIEAIKAIPGLNLAASLVNAIVAGSVVIALGAGCCYVFEKIYTGEKSPDDINWIRQVMENAAAKNMVNVVNAVTVKMKDPKNKDSIRKVLLEVLEQVFKSLGRK